MERFFGGSPALVLIRLAIISLIVGVLLSILGLDPLDIVDSLRRLALNLYDMGFEAIERILRYLLLGAAIVVPIWLISRLFKLAGRSGGRALDRGHHGDL